MDIIDQLKKHEGFSSHPYRCPAGKLTIGYGFTFLTEEESELILRVRVYQLQNTLTPRISGLSELRQAVLVNMAYNLGVQGLYSFKKMWSAIEAGDYDQAATEMLDSLWAEQVGQRAIELSEQMRHG